MRQVISFAKRRYWASIIIGAVAPGSMAAVIMYIVTDGVTGLWPVGAAVLGGLLTAGALKLISGHEPANQSGIALPPQPSSNQSEIVQLPAQPTDRPGIMQPSSQLADQPEIVQPRLPAHLVQGKAISPRSPDDLVNEVKGKTDIMRQHTIRPYLGQWLYVTGHIRNVRQGALGDVITVSADLTKSDVSVILRFDSSSWQARLQVAHIGDTISAIGKFKDVEFYGGDGIVSLDECELFDLTGNPPTS